MKEIWKDIPNTDGWYQVSNIGRVKSFNRRGNGLKKQKIGVILTPSIVQGYPLYEIPGDKIKGAKKRRVGKHAHRWMWLAFVGEIPDGYELDHIDRNRMNCLLSNLRLVTRVQQQANVGKKCPGGKSSSKFKGVYWLKKNNKWAAHIRTNGKRRFLGLFTDEIEAALAYNNAAIQRSGEYANINIIPN